MKMTGPESETNIILPHCKYFVIRKKRFCRMTIKKGLEYCGEHQPKLEATEDVPNPRLRIPCPLDSNHTCFASKLNKHLKKCNAKFDASSPYISRGINSGCSENVSNVTRQLSDVTSSHILEVIEKVNEIYNELIVNSITERILSHDLLTAELERPDYGANSRKHLIQSSSLLAHLLEANLIQPNTCFVEFGAGKGQFSYWVSKASNSIPGTSVLLVERACLRHKLDNKLDKSENNVHRIRADIADLMLHKVSIVNESEKIVGFTKHLCGDATDLALKCMMNSSEEKKISGLVMAFCCHHRCHWSEYTGKAFFEQNNLSMADFDVICGLVSWATCGTGESRTKTPNKEGDKQGNVEARKRDAEIGLTKQEKETIGKKCKLVIDYGRYCYLTEHDFKCSLFYYVSQNVSLENVCIVAYK